MNVEIEMYIDEDDETLVMQKVSSLTKQAKDAGFKIGEIEFKSCVCDKANSNIPKIVSRPFGSTLASTIRSR
jgi:hypothetical protein